MPQVMERKGKAAFSGDLCHLLTDSIEGPAAVHFEEINTNYNAI